MAEFDAIAEQTIAAITHLDSAALHESSEKFLDAFSIHYTSAEWTRFAATDGGFACLLGFELSHLHLGSEVGMTQSILTSFDSSLASSEQAMALRKRWELIGLPIEIGNIENDWKRCLNEIAAHLDSSGEDLPGEFEQVLFERSGIVTFSLLKKLVNQISQSEALMGAVLTMKGVTNDTQALLVKWLFSDGNKLVVPEGFESYMGPSGVSGSSPK